MWHRTCHRYKSRLTHPCIPISIPLSRSLLFTLYYSPLSLYPILSLFPCPMLRLLPLPHTFPISLPNIFPIPLLYISLPIFLLYTILLYLVPIPRPHLLSLYLTLYLGPIPRPISRLYTSPYTSALVSVLSGFIFYWYSMQSFGDAEAYMGQQYRGYIGSPYRVAI